MRSVKNTNIYHVCLIWQEAIPHSSFKIDSVKVTRGIKIQSTSEVSHARSIRSNNKRTKANILANSSTSGSTSYRSNQDTGGVELPPQKHRREQTYISIRVESIQFAVTVEWPLHRFICSTWPASVSVSKIKAMCLQSITLHRSRYGDNTLFVCM